MNSGDISTVTFDFYVSFALPLSLPTATAVHPLVLLRVDMASNIVGTDKLGIVGI